jgi:hypothetical protein
MNKANQRELDKAIAWLDLNDDDATEMAWRIDPLRSGHKADNPGAGS